MPLKIIKDDITKIKCGAIVNPTNKELFADGGVDLSIHKVAGHMLKKACSELGTLETGEAKITPAFDLPCSYVIHTVGPVWQGGICNERKLLESCYKNALRIAIDKGLDSIAFPLISSGAYGYPKDQVLKVATSVISAFLESYDILVYLVIYDKNAYDINPRVLSDVQAFIESEHQINSTHIDCLRSRARERTSGDFDSLRERRTSFFEGLSKPQVDDDRIIQMPKISKPIVEDTEDNSRGRLADKNRRDLSTDETLNNIVESIPRMVDDEFDCIDDISKWLFQPIKTANEDSIQRPKTLEEMLKEMDCGFAQTLFRYIDEKGISDVDCYKRSNVDKKTFSKIKCSATYKPSKVTVISFAIGLHLNLNDTKHLLNTAGFSLSKSNVFDIIIEYFITSGNYKDIYDVNEVLYKFDQVTLGV